MEQEVRHHPGLPLLPTAPKPGGPFGRVRRLFVRGLGVLLPTLLTILIILWAYSLLDRYANVWLQYLLAWYRNWPIEYTKVYWDKHNLGWAGLLINLVLVFLVGLALANVLGRGIWRIVEGIILRIPVIKQVYPYVKQVTDFVLRERPLEFSRVVLVQYPRLGCWSMGFLVGGGFGPLCRHLGRDMVTVFVPTSPTPMTGYVIQVPREEAVEVNLSVDTALRFVISCGVIGPADRIQVELGQPQPQDQARPSQS